MNLHRKENKKTNLHIGSVSVKAGFTIVELIIVIVVIAILATMSLVAYNGIQDRADDAKVKGDASNSSRQLSLKQIEGGSYPAGNTNPGLTFSEGTSVFYNSDGVAYELTVVSDRKDSISYCITSETSIPKKGPCDAHVALVGGGNDEGGGSTEPVLTYMQEMDSSDCTSERSMVIDKRDNKTYWVKKIGGNCWMMTDLAYDGGGDNTHGDVKSMQLGGAAVYTPARYYKDSGMTSTTHPQEPSTSTSGAGQYGYYYNYCAAMGGQSAVCVNGGGNSSSASASQSVCPSGWRLPSRSDFNSLTSSLGAGDNAAGFNILKNEWFAQLNGYWWTGQSLGRGVEGNYWSSTDSNSMNAYNLFLKSDEVFPDDTQNKQNNFAVRCAAS